MFSDIRGRRDFEDKISEDYMQGFGRDLRTRGPAGRSESRKENQSCSDTKTRPICTVREVVTAEKSMWFAKAG